MDESKPKPRRWFRFSLRTLLIFVTVFCGVLSLGIVQWKWTQDRQDALKRLHHTRNRVSVSSKPLRGFRFRILGGLDYHEIEWVRLDDKDKQIEDELRHLFPEARVSSMDEIEFLERHPHFHNGRRVKSFDPLVYADTQ
jgi:hypothetical protein